MRTQNPWIGFAHPDHQSDELEPLVRTLRYALIDMQKFWVEVQSIPVFMSGLNACTLEEIESIFKWVVSSPSWSDQIESTRLIRELSLPTTRKKIQEFARSVLCVRAILDELNAKVAKAGHELGSLDEVWKKVTEGRRIIERRKGEAVENLTRTDLDSRLSEASKSWNEIKDVLQFFADLSQQTGAPRATHAQEGLKILRALESIAKIPGNIRSWRTPHVLEASQRIRLQAWRDRARPILELRTRLETFFNLEADVTAEELTQLAEALRAEGLFAQFKAPYKEALEKYRSLLRGGVALKVDAKNNGFQKAEKLKEWISLLEQSRNFAQQAEAKQAFSPQFQGIDTDFSAALEANAWAKTLREEYFSQDPEAPVDGVTLAFDTAVIEFISRIPEDKIAQAAQFCAEVSAKTARVQALLMSPEFQQGGSFSAIEQERAKRYWDYKKLREIAAETELSPQVRMHELKEISEHLEEAYFLIQRIESDETLKMALKEIFAGIHTDLSQIEPCAAYVKAVKSAELPGNIESLLLTNHGPQRLDDARSLVARCLTRVNIVRDHYRKLEMATRDEVRTLSGGKELEYAPVVELIDRIQAALKSAQFVADAVAELRAKRDSELTGLKVDRESAPVSAAPRTPLA